MSRPPRVAAERLCEASDLDVVGGGIGECVTEHVDSGCDSARIGPEVRVSIAVVGAVELGSVVDNPCDVAECHIRYPHIADLRAIRLP